MYRFNRILALLLTLLCVASLAACTIEGDLHLSLGAVTLPATTEAPTTEPVDPPVEPTYDVITIAEALELCGESGNVTEERYYIRGTVVSIKDARYGSMTVQDETGTIDVYGTYSADGSIGYADLDEQPYKGDVVLLHCILQNYNGTKEVKNARLISFEHNDTPVDESAYTEMTIGAARDTAEGTKVKVDGVVAAITYANGQKPAGVYLVDETQSIYVYDRDLAGRVQVGNTVTVLASKTLWVLESEQANAEKHGYKGCCQLEDVTVVSLDPSVKDFDKSWIEETTVKRIMDTPVAEIATTSIYKVNALVKKAEGTGFTNYYFNDLDGKTGSYAYTQCNGKDFAWLDQFDGKICTVYLSVINAKSTASGCNYRFLPVAVEDNGFVFDMTQAPAHVIEYYVVDQFLPQYTGDPVLELITSVSSELLGFENIAVSYTSSNEATVRIAVEEGKTVMHCGDFGKATITVTVSHEGTTASRPIEITVASAQTFETITVADAIAAADDSEVLIKGIVGPSVVNKDGFYLFDGTGMIAVLVKDKSVFGELAIGNEIVIKGRRENYVKSTTTAAVGQIAVVDAELMANYFGKHEYPTDKFITGKTMADLYALNPLEHHSTEAYLVRCVIKLEKTGYYTSLKIQSADGSVTLTLYCSGAGQYEFLHAYAGQEVLLELAPCNWNDKKFYAFCALAVYTEDGGKIVNELNFKVN